MAQAAAFQSSLELYPRNFRAQPSAQENLFSFAAQTLKGRAKNSVTLLLVPPRADPERAKLIKRAQRRSASSRRSSRSWRSLQRTLPYLSLPAKVVTPLMGKIFDIVKRISSAKTPMPTNAEMAEMLGRGRQSIAKAFDKLVALGRLRVDQRHGFRRVYVVGQCSMTSWGEHRPGHAPFCKNPRGTPPEQIIARQPAERIGRAQGFGLLGIPSYQRYAYEHAVLHSPLDAGPSRQCQWITSLETATHPTFCGARSSAGKSWCPGHLAEVFS
jgi:hypothetical protein